MLVPFIILQLKKAINQQYVTEIDNTLQYYPGEAPQNSTLD